MKKQRLVIMTVVLLLWGALPTFAQQAPVAALIVNAITCGDSASSQSYSVADATDLIDAILCANQGNASTDTITLTSDISLTTAYNNGNEGIPSITTPIVIDGDTYVLQRAYTTCDLADSDPDFRLFTVSSAGTLELRHLKLQNGCLAGDGATIYSSGTLNLLDVIIENGQTIGTNADGAAMFLADGTVNVVNSIIRDNHAIASAGAFQCTSSVSSMSVVNSLFYDNTSGGNGGAIRTVCPITFTNATVVDNTSSGSGGGMVMFTGADVTVNNSIFFGNTGNSDIRVFGGSLTVENSLYNSINADVTWTDNGGNLTGTSPRFNDFSNDDWSLKSDSPAINAGDNALLPTDSLDVDGDGNTTETLSYDLRGSQTLRISDSTVDMGAYEYEVLTPYASVNVLYVDTDNTSGIEDGLSWVTAFSTLQSALTIAEKVSVIDEIWVAEGIYYPDEGLGQTSDSNSSTFQLQSGVAIYGGFAGAGDLNGASDATTLNSFADRDPDTYITILSGDIDKNDTATTPTTPPPK